MSSFVDRNQIPRLGFKFANVLNNLTKIADVDGWYLVFSFAHDLHSGTFILPGFLEHPVKNFLPITVQQSSCYNGCVQKTFAVSSVLQKIFFEFQMLPSRYHRMQIKLRINKSSMKCNKFLLVIDPTTTHHKSRPTQNKEYWTVTSSILAFSTCQPSNN